MSRPLDKESVIKNKKEAIKTLNKMLEYFINDPSGKNLKKANLLSYWLKDYVRFINFEATFDPKRNISYKRGDVIKVGFGFNIGSEYGGLHYAIVLDKVNDHSSSTVTVVPLTSIKSVSSEKRHTVSLGNEIYKLLNIKCITTLQGLSDEQQKIKEMQESFDRLYSLAEQGLEIAQSKEPHSPEYKAGINTAKKTVAQITDMLSELNEKSKKIDQLKDEVTKIAKEISNMKEGSIALVGQVTTISKIRIYDPKKSNDVLAGISLSKEGMQKINDKFKELYIFES